MNKKSVIRILKLLFWILGGIPIFIFFSIPLDLTDHVNALLSPLVFFYLFTIIWLYSICSEIFAAIKNLKLKLGYGIQQEKIILRSDPLIRSAQTEKKLEITPSEKIIDLSNNTETKEEQDLTPASVLFIVEQDVNMEEEKERFPVPKKVNWDSVQKARKQTGDFGEAIVAEYERAVLLKRGKQRLSNKVALVSSKNLGYDVFSTFDDGSGKYIEVKAFAGSKASNFIVTRNELNFMQKNPDSSFVYMVTDCDTEPKILKMCARQFFKLKLKPSVFKITL